MRLGAPPQQKKTNYHIHLIFSERRLLPEPDIRIATSSVFCDETGKRIRTKKEITGEDGTIRKDCTVIKKGEAYHTAGGPCGAHIGHALQVCELQGMSSNDSISIFI